VKTFAQDVQVSRGMLRPVGNVSTSVGSPDRHRMSFHSKDT